MIGNRIDTVLKELGRLRQAKYKRTYEKKMRAHKRIVGQVGKRMAEHIVGARSLAGICHIIVRSHRSRWRGLHPRGAGAASYGQKQAIEQT